MKHWRILLSYALVLGLIFGGMFVAGCRDTVFDEPDDCVADCTGMECGDDGCGGSCGECAPGQLCQCGLCVGCVPECTGRECGNDGCGGSCGTCDSGEFCQSGLCVTGSDVVMPLDIGNRWELSLDVMGMEATLFYEATGTESVGGITATRIEGGCTGNPLLCSSMEGYYWLAANQEDGLYSYGDSRFGEYDPPNLHCSTSFSVGDTWETLDDEGNTVAWEVVSTTETVTVPAGTFADCVHYRATSGAEEERWYHMGAGNVKTLQDGYVVMELANYSYEGECVPDCTGMECGDDGCGGSCGECGANESCEDGICEACVPECTGMECGDDGCGGSCGECGADESCEDGICVGCVPDCSGRECGGDGCGGSCGECGAGETCDAGLCVEGVEVVMPLDIGNRWENSLTVLMDPPLEASITYEATGTETAGDVTATRIDGECTGNPLICSRMVGYWYLAVNEGDGLYSYADSNFGAYDPPNLLCSTTFNVGDTWQTKNDEGDPVDWEVVSTSETVTVPAGTFTDCIHYRSTAGADEERWYHLGTGTVKTLADGIIRLELTGYSHQ